MSDHSRNQFHFQQPTKEQMLARRGGTAMRGPDGKLIPGEFDGHGRPLDGSRGATAADRGPSPTFHNAFGKDGTGNPTGNRPPEWNARFHGIGSGDGPSPSAAPQLQTQPTTGSGTVTKSMAAQGVGRPAPAGTPGISNPPPVNNDRGQITGAPGGPLPPAPVNNAGRDALLDWGANADADKAKAVAGTGAVAQTRYGTVSSRTAAPSEGGENVMRPLVGDQSTGVKHAAPGDDWQQRIIAKYKPIGVADSPENKAFVAAYNNAQAGQAAAGGIGLPGGGPIDPHAIADQVMKRLGTNKDKPSPASPAPRNWNVLTPAPPSESNPAPPVAIRSQNTNFLDPRERVAATPTDFAGMTAPLAPPIDAGNGTSIDPPSGTPAVSLGNDGLTGPNFGGTGPAAPLTMKGGVRIGMPGIDLGFDPTLPPIATAPIPGSTPGGQNPGNVMEPPGGSAPLAPLTIPPAIPARALLPSPSTTLTVDAAHQPGPPPPAGFKDIGAADEKEPRKKLAAAGATGSGASFGDFGSED